MTTRTPFIVIAAGVLAAVVSTALGQGGPSGGNPELDALCYDECDATYCDDPTMQGGYCTCIGKSPCGGSGVQYRGNAETRITFKCHGLTDPDTALVRLSPDCGLKLSRSAGCIWNNDLAMCECGTPFGTWLPNSGEGIFRYDTATCGDGF
jgi:hypothetical protein